MWDCTTYISFVETSVYYEDPALFCVENKMKHGFIWCIIKILNHKGEEYMGVRKRRVACKLIAVVMGLAMMLSLIPMNAKSVQAATLPADVSKPSSGCVFIAMEGQYVSGASAAIKKINHIRYEACEKGVKLNGRRLTLKDYVPIKWSAGLEKIARIRAAESSITMGHARLNGKTVFDFKYPGNGWPTAEVIAWNWSDGMLMAIDQWHSEMDDYVSGKAGAVTGHYTAMINPNNRYVGIGTFIGKTASYRNTTAAQFMGNVSQSEKVAKATGKCSATIEVKNSNITALKLTGTKNIDRAQKTSLALRAVLGSYGGDSYRVLSGAKWTSSNNSVAKVSSTGVVTGLKKGTVKITARIGAKSASFNVTVSGKCAHSYSGKVVKCATTKADGQVLHICKVCGHKRYIAVKSIKSVKLSGTSYKYDGKTKTPSVTVKDAAGKNIPAKYYKVTYPKTRVKVGTYKVKITFSGRYTGTVTREYKIVR